MWEILQEMEAFNRTIVELKLSPYNLAVDYIPTFNRTIVELKLFHVFGEYVSYLLLIVLS